MPITTVAVTCNASRPDGSFISGGKFRFLLSAADTENGLVVPREISAIANSSGVAIANLWPNSLGAAGTQYRVLLSDPLGGTIDLGVCTVPNSACSLHSILGLGTAPTLDQATVAKLAAQQSAAESFASATQSASSAAAALVSKNAAAASQTASAGSATAAATSATSAAADCVQTGLDRTQTGSDKTATAADRVQTGLDRTAVLTNKTQSDLDAVATAADRLQTGLDRTAASTSATASASSATAAASSATSASASATSANAVLSNANFVKVSQGIITPRVVAIADATSITLNAETTDIGLQVNTQAAGTLTINAPTGTLVNGQKIILRVASTNIQTLAWNSVFKGSDDLPLPTATSGSGKYDYYGLLYSSAASSWMLIAKIGGF